jgi:exopolysaccharide biosynthesis protein
MSICNIVSKTLLFTIVFNINLVSFSQTKHFTKNYFNNIVHIIEVDDIEKIKPIAKRPGNNLYKFVSSNKSWGGINGGFFNYSDGYPVSKVYINSILIDEPEKNKALINNNELKPILNKIFNRCELRIINSNGKKKLNICSHNYPFRKGEKRLHSLQAGPQLLPVVTLEEEGFILKNKHGHIIRDSISSFSNRARSAVGINEHNNLIFVSVGSKNGLNIQQLSLLMKELGAVKAMALDGGSSVSMVWSENNKYNYFSSMGKSPALINSAFLID